MNTLRHATLALLLAALPACGDAEMPPPPAAPADALPAATRGEPVEPYDGPAMELVMTPVGDEMRFEQTAFTVKPGQVVRLVFQNTATMEAMQHNVVFVTSPDDIQPVGQAAMSAADTEYIPTSEGARIMAYTPLAAPGETVEVEFTAPLVPGDYPYICTYPGHFVLMQGTMTVER